MDYFSIFISPLNIYVPLFEASNTISSSNVTVSILNRQTTFIERHHALSR